MLSIWTNVLEAVHKCDDRACRGVAGGTNAEMYFQFLGRIWRLGAYDLYRYILRHTLRRLASKANDLGHGIVVPRIFREVFGEPHS